MFQSGSATLQHSDSLTGGIRPPNLTPLPKAVRFFYSMFSIYGGGGHQDAILKWPWRIAPSEFGSNGPGPLCAGFGPLFALGLILSILWFVSHPVYTRWKNDNGSIHKGLISLALILLVFSMFFPQGWWARFVPFAYAVPFLLLLSLYPRETRPHFSLYLLLCVFAANSWIPAKAAYISQGNTQIEFARIVASLRKLPPHSVYLLSCYPEVPHKNLVRLTKAHINIQRRLHEQGIESAVKTGVPCTHKAWSVAEWNICY